MTAYIQIHWTTDSVEEAKTIAHKLLKKKWIACANIIPNVVSIYNWGGKVQEDTEVKVFLKTTDEFYEDVRDFIIEQASYDIPEVAKILVDDSNPAYTQWLLSSIS